MKTTLAVCAVPMFALLAAMAASLDPANDPATGGPGAFAAREIHREALAHGMTFGNDANATGVVSATFLL